MTVGSVAPPVPVQVPATRERVGVPESAFVSVKVAVTVTLSPDLYGPVKSDDPLSVYVRTTVGVVLSMVNDVVWLDATAATLPDSSEMPLTVRATVAEPSEPEDGTSYTPRQTFDPLEVSVRVTVVALPPLGVTVTVGDPVRVAPPPVSVAVTWMATDFAPRTGVASDAR